MSSIHFSQLEIAFSASTTCFSVFILPAGRHVMLLQWLVISVRLRLDFSSIETWFQSDWDFTSIRWVRFEISILSVRLVMSIRLWLKTNQIETWDFNQMSKTWDLSHIKTWDFNQVSDTSDFNQVSDTSDFNQVSDTSDFNHTETWNLIRWVIFETSINSTRWVRLVTSIRLWLETSLRLRLQSGECIWDFNQFNQMNETWEFIKMSDIWDFNYFNQMSETWDFN